MLSERFSEFARANPFGSTTRARKRPAGVRRAIQFEALEERAVLAVAPSGIDGSVTIVEDTDYVFTADDFAFTDPGDVPPDDLLGVAITTLPGRGSLTNDGAPLFPGQLIPVEDIEAGLLVFTTIEDTAEVPYAEFTFQVKDDGGMFGGSEDLDPTPNSFSIFVADARSNYVTGLYQKTLGRLPEPAGLANWVGILDSGTPRLTVAAGLWESPEHRGIQVDEYFQRFLHRDPAPAGRQAWIDAMLGGATEEQVMEAFLTTSEYQLTNVSDTAFVVATFSDLLGRLPNPAGQTIWVGELVSGGLTREGVAERLIDTHERHLKLVDAYYQQYLGRDPDSAGWTAWTTELDEGRLTDAEVAERLLATPEFFSILHG